MPKFKILSDSSCDIRGSLLESLDIELVPFYVSFDNKNYLKENIDITIDEFYSRLSENGVYAKTSLPSVKDYMDAFEKYLEQGLDIICVCLSQKFSGSYQSAFNASVSFLEKYPDRKIKIIDSEQATATQGMLLVQMTEMRDLGYSFEEIIEKSEELIKNALLAFSVDSLEYLQKGGRIGKVSAIAGTILQIKPIIIMSDGELIPHSKVRRRKKAIKKIKETIDDFVKGKREEYVYSLFQSTSYEEALELKKELIDEINIDPESKIYDCGVTIGTHTGPTLIGIAVMKNFKYL